ncbi:AzlD domain-containing protein [Streptococcus plurextorum]|uniref:AzlD domain-containing protein n=1 Tax=Streptococcus plurextorum TaxID=456876 RepID=UPI0003FB868C|nr:AzlD domain-containing protein [Streptococcus plurextorum]
MTSTYLLAAIVLSALVTWLPRVLPYFIVRLVTLPEKLVKFFNFLPISIIFALLLASLFDTKVGQFPTVKLAELLAVIPTLWVMLKTKNVMLAVVLGCVTIALLRLVV